MAEERPLCFCFSSDFSTLCTKITHEKFMRFLHKLTIFVLRETLGQRLEEVV